MSDAWSGDLDLSQWLRPGETVRWMGRSHRASLSTTTRLMPLYVSGPALLIAIVVPQLRVFGVFVAAAYGIAATIGVSNAKRALDLNRYVLTDRRAAVFQVPSRLIAQTSVSTQELQVKRSPRGHSGTVDWGPALEETQSGTVGHVLGSLGLKPDPIGVTFEDVFNLDVLLREIAAVRAALGLNTPEPQPPARRGRPPVALGFLDRRAAGWANGVALVISVSVFGSAVVLLLLTFSGGVPLFTYAPVAVLFVLMFPIFLWALVIAMGRQQRSGERLPDGTVSRRPRRPSADGGLPLEYLPVWVLVALAAIFILGVLSGAGVFNGKDLPGQPFYDPATHTYSADDGGTVVRITHDQYDRAVDAQNRLFLSVVVVFASIGVAAEADEVLRRRRSPYVRRGE